MSELSGPGFLIALRGYDRSAVDTVVEQLEAALKSDNAGVRAEAAGLAGAATFPVVMRGYDRRQVDDYLAGARTSLAA
jgi:hypothetical protein